MSPRARSIPERGNAPIPSKVTTTATIQVRVTVTARSQNDLMRILAAGTHARLIPAGDGLFRVVAENKGATLTEVSPL